MTEIAFTKTAAMPVDNPFGSVPGLPEHWKLICTSDSCFCRSVFDNIVDTYKSLGNALVINSTLFVSPEVAAKVIDNPSLAPERY